MCRKHIISSKRYNDQPPPIHNHMCSCLMTKTDRNMSVSIKCMLFNRMHTTANICLLYVSRLTLVSCHIGLACSPLSCLLTCHTNCNCHVWNCCYWLKLISGLKCCLLGTGLTTPSLQPDSRVCRAGWFLFRMNFVIFLSKRRSEWAWNSIVQNGCHGAFSVACIVAVGIGVLSGV